MNPRIVPLFTALLLAPAACDNAKVEAKKDDAKKTATKAANLEAGDAKKASDIEKIGADQDADANSKAAKAGDGATEDDKAKKAAKRKEQVANAYAKLEAWKTKEAARWTDELQAKATELAKGTHKDLDAALTTVLASPHRYPDNIVRDKDRHPAETLKFFGLEPEMTVIEIDPGQGWYTEILAPMLANSGKLLITDNDPNGPEEEGRTMYARWMQAFLERSDDLFGKVERIVQDDPKSLNLGPDAAVDMVFVFRGLHSWIDRGQFEDNIKKVHAVLKPGGILAIVQHRAKPDAKPEESAKQGYLPEAWVIEHFEAAGFELEEKSEINANPKDIKDYPEGVWTLPPSLAMGDKDKDKWLAIGESDRMTLRFVKS